MKTLWHTFLGYLAVGFLAIPWSLVAAWLGVSGIHWLPFTIILALNFITTFLILRRFKFMRRIFDILKLGWKEDKISKQPPL